MCVSVGPTRNRATIDLPELKIDQGERIFLQGPSGSGKSTLLSLVGGILVAESGSLRVLGEELKKPLTCPQGCLPRHSPRVYLPAF